MPGPETQQDILWPAKRVRDTFVKFFEDKNHVYWKSSPVVPFNDPTLLFANAGTLPLSLILLLLLFTFNTIHRIS
jgi:alanyl-tRNA synthetase